MIMISNSLFNFSNFCIIICFFLTIVVLGILILTVAKTEFVAKPLILFILPSVSVMVALQSVFLTKPLVSGILFLFLNYLYHT